VSEQVACVRCGKALALGEADIVGNGYRCAPCTAHVQHVGGEEADVADNVAPEVRERLAKKGKQNFIASLGAASVVVAVPAAVAFAVSGGIAALVAGGLGAYVGSSWLSAAGETYYAQWKRYRQPPLPKAKLRK
jgi:hypothetical protein